MTAALVKRNDEQEKCDSVDIRNGDVDIFSSTWEVVGGEWVFHLIDVGLKLINFELNEKTKKPQKDQ